MSKKKICLFIVSLCFAMINAQDYDKFIGEWSTDKSDIILRIYFSNTNNRFDFWQYKEIETLDYYNCKTKSYKYYPIRFVKKSNGKLKGIILYWYNQYESAYYKTTYELLEKNKLKVTFEGYYNFTYIYKKRKN